MTHCYTCPQTLQWHCPHKKHIQLHTLISYGSLMEIKLDYGGPMGYK